MRNIEWLKSLNVDKLSNFLANLEGENLIGATKFAFYAGKGFEKSKLEWKEWLEGEESEDNDI